MKDTITTLRPSSLPKVAVCSKYTNSPFVAGPAADRGTLADEAYRLFIMKERITCPECDGNPCPADAPCRICTGAEIDDKGTVCALDILDARIEKLSTDNNTTLAPARDGVEWAINYTYLLAGDEEVIADEDRLRVKIEECDSEGGTMDADIPALAHGIDLKTGMLRGYKEQFAAYALGRMRADFLEEYSFTGVFSDQRQAVKYHFSLEEAEMIVTTLRRNSLDPDHKATPCEYCSWCGSFDTCHERRELATRVASHQNLQERWDLIKADPEELGLFLTSATEYEEFVKDGKKSALELFDSGVEVPGYKRVNGRAGSKFMPPENLVAFCDVNGLSLYDVVHSLGKVSKSKLISIAKEHGAEEAIENAENANYMEGASGSPYVAKCSKKKAKK